MQKGVPQNKSELGVSHVTIIQLTTFTAPIITITYLVLVFFSSNLLTIFYLFFIYLKKFF